MLKVLSDILLAIDTGDLSARCSWTCPRPSTQSTTVFCSDDWRLHWLDIPERVNLTTVTGVCSARRQCTYQTAAFQSVKSLHGGIRSAARHQLTVRRHRLSTYGRRAFAVAGPIRCLTLCQMIYEILRSALQPSDSR